MNLIGEKISYKPDDQFHLNDVSFNFKKGNLYTILGRTLSGKTTLLKTIAGLLNPDQGSISFEEKDFIKIPVWERNVAMVYQQFINYPHLNVYENITFPLEQRKLSSEQIKKDVDEALKTVGLVGFENRKIQELSGGQQQRVAIARALVQDPAFVLADEPTGNLDKESGINILNILKDLNNQGKTVIMITHNQEHANMFKKVIELVDGKIVSK